MAKNKKIMLQVRFKGEAEGSFRNFIYNEVWYRHPDLSSKIINHTDNWNEDGSFDFEIEVEDVKTAYRLGYEFAMYAKGESRDDR